VTEFAGYKRTRSMWRCGHKHKRVYRWWLRAATVAVKLSVMQVLRRNNSRGRLEVYSCTFGDDWRVLDAPKHYHIGHGSDWRWG
jgi:hypothetical protein